MGGAPEHPPSVSLLVANEMEGTAPLPSTDRFREELERLRVRLAERPRVLNQVLPICVRYGPGASRCCFIRRRTLGLRRVGRVSVGRHDERTLKDKNERAVVGRTVLGSFPYRSDKVQFKSAHFGDLQSSPPDSPQPPRFILGKERRSGT